MTTPGIKCVKLLAVVGAFVLYGATSASAGPITFDFNSLNANSTNANVQTYMNGVLAAASAGTVTVTGADVDTTYNGDGHVVGTVNYHTVTSVTLGPDAFLDTYSSSQFQMVFSGAIASVSFNYEIFPNGNCTSLSTFLGFYTQCGGWTTTPTNLPDFTFKADGVQYLHAVAVTPSGLTHSPNSGYNHTEYAPQLGPTASGTIFLPDVHTLTFIDWPATIGIDDLVITFEEPPGTPKAGETVPEPASLVLLATGLVGAAALRRRAMKR